VYAPASYAEPAELRALAEEAVRHDLVYSTHIRDEADGLLDAVDEAIELARASGVRLEISHLKAIGPANWGRVREALARIEAARRAGVDVGADQYPYAASSTTLTSRLPGWALDGGVPALLRRLADPAESARIAADLAAREGRSFQPERVVIAGTGEGEYARFAGASIATVASALGLPPAEATLEVLRAQRGVVSVVNHAMAPDDVDTVLADPQVAVASDGWVLRDHGDGCPHPRSFGTFVRVLGHYVRERGVLDLPTAVAKMTSVPAARCGWTDRGVVREGAVADLAVFDPDTVAERATYEDPWQLADGVLTTLVGGVCVVEEGRPTGARPGRVVRRTRRKGDAVADLPRRLS